ncbi:uncharacterized protein H6S33_009431 [Morchella sextelata]|uniref:uncharacterized protein n=1 Tax=Morchella sextelata TaxID=1174677 RepID=UPI001D04FF83|nr:uncharacterized protein H6S33_009431 [Morchella sextelata]KAH0613051.1 hypothetical protein H6S33_009431 [Morchella sextelata]
MANRRNGTPTLLRELYNPPGTEPTVDIVFVHGLNPLNTQDFAEKTWTHANGALWPRDILPSNVPECRILLFGYNSNVAFDVSNQGIKDHANTLLDRLGRNRKVTENSKTRPIIFVGHSLGGLVIKQALINATNNYEEYGVIKEATRGLVFFGTPHRGGNGASLGQVAANIITAVSGADRNDILRSLSSDSILTKNSNDDFRHQSERYRVLTFYETRKTKVDRWLSGIFGCVFNAIVVDADSAKLGLAGARENQLPIDADHSGICKFESADDRYEPVGGLIEQLVERILEDKTEPEESVLPRDSGVSAFKTLLPSSRLNVERSPNFSGREYEINRIYEHLTTLSSSTRLSRRVVVLHGLGGIGKTEIALAYAFKYRHEYTAVFWIDATNSQTATLGLLQIVQGLIDANITDEYLAIDCATIARRLGIPGLVQEDGLLNSNLGEVDKERVIKAAKRLVETEENKNVLIIYDNYDDIESYDLSQNFPLIQGAF